MKVLLKSFKGSILIFLFHGKRHYQYTLYIEYTHEDSDVVHKNHLFIILCILILVITKDYGVQETMIEDQNTFAPSLCFA